jgi:predicted TIM-barrel fold metal-dependent hydrolase
LADVDLDDVDRALDTGAVGVCLPSGAIGSPALLDRLGPLLERIERCGVPLFVHPGPGLGDESGGFTSGPVWWPALTDYVASMQAAWLAWIAGGRAAHPRLRIVFAMLAGGAPLQVERLAARGEPTIALADDLTFYDTSSYGPLAIDAVAQVVGRQALVYGSDRPVVDARVPAGADAEALLVDNPARLFARTREVVAR